MRILVSNDDGILSPGIAALSKALLEAGHEVNVAAPIMERSGAGHSCTMYARIEVRDAAMPGLEQIPAYAIGGTPADCVRLGLDSLFPRPDLVMTGINIGTNLGGDVFNSGTINAAAVAVEMGLPAIALSNSARFPAHLEVSAAVASRAVEEVLPKLAGQDKVLVSINIPDLPAEEIRGVKATPAARPNPKFSFTEYISPRQRRWYWDVALPLSVYEPDEDADERWLRAGYITVTPLRFEVNHRRQLALLKEAELKLL